MRDLIAQQQTAALQIQGRSLLPSSAITPDFSGQEILDAESNNSASDKILSDILSTLKKMLFVIDDTKESIDEISNQLSMSLKREVSSSSGATAVRAPIEGPALLKLPFTPAPTAEAVKTSDPTISQANLEQANEDRKLLEKQVSLLEGILEALGGEAKSKEEKPKEAKGGGGILSSILESFFGQAAKGGIKNIAKNILGGLLKGILKVGLIGIAAGLFSGIIDGIKVLFNGGSLKDAVIAAAGGFLEFITFGLFDAESIKGWLASAGEIWDSMVGAIDEYVVQPFNNMVETISTALDEYLVQPIVGFIEAIDGLFTDYIIKPIEGFIDQVTSVFTSIADAIKGFMDSFKLPSIFGGSDDKKKAESAKSSSAPMAKEAKGGDSTKPSEAKPSTAAKETKGGSAWQSMVESFTKSPPKEIAALEAQYPGITKEFISIAEKTPPKDSSVSGMTTHIKTLTEQTVKKMSSTVKQETSKTQQVTAEKTSAPTTSEASTPTAAAATVTPMQSGETKAVGAPSTQSNQVNGVTPNTAAVTPSATSSNRVLGTSAANAEKRDSMIASPTVAPTIVSAPTTNVQNKQNITMPQSIRNPDSSFTDYMIRNRVF